MYADAFNVPVVYVNSRGSLEYMPGKMGKMMQKHGFRMNGMSHIYANNAENIETDILEAEGVIVNLKQNKRCKDISLHCEDILPGNWLFKKLILEPDTKDGILSYEANR